MAPALRWCQKIRALGEIRHCVLVGVLVGVLVLVGALLGAGGPLLGAGGPPLQPRGGFTSSA